MQYPPYGKRTFQCALAVVLACGLAPAAGYAQPTIEDAAAFGGSASSDSNSSSLEAVPGEAIVLYRTSTEVAARGRRL